MNISRILLLILLDIIILRPCSAQGFLRTYAPDASSLNAAVQTLDGGYFAVGQVSTSNDLFLLRTDALGQSLWSQQTPLNGAHGIAVAAAADGSFMVLTEKYLEGAIERNALLHVDASGNILSTLLIPNLSLPNGLNDLIPLSDGNFMAAGITRDANFNMRNWLVKIAPDGSLIWEKPFGTAGRNIRKIIELSDENIAVSGQLNDYYLAKLSFNGDLLWEKNYAAPGNQTNYGLLSTNDGNIALLGTSQDLAAGSLNIDLLKTDLNGVPIWHKDYYPFPTPFSNPYLPVLNGFAQDGAGNFYVPFWGFGDDPGAADLELLKLSSEGNAQWKHALEVSGNIWQVIKSADNQLLMAGDNNGLSTNALLLKTDLEGDFQSNKISGHIYRDDDVDCAFTAGEPGMSDFIVEAKNDLGETFFKKTNSDGSYLIRVTEGQFKLFAHPSLAPATYYAQCDTPTINVTGSSQNVAAPNLMEQILGECPSLLVEVSGGLLRRCLPVWYNLNWCNSGNLPATNTLLQVVKHPFLVYQNSSWPLASQSGDTLLFDIGTVPAGNCESLNIQFIVDCAAQLGDVLCLEAYITPDSSCAPPDLNWDGSQIEVSGACNGTEIEFKIKNTGASDMTEAVDYVIIEDEIMYAQPAIQLLAGQEMTSIRMPMPEDSCFALQVFPNQTSLLRKPVAVVANCTSNGNLNLLLSLPNNENDPAVAIDCNEVIGSYDPNDKVGFPMGLTPAHYIEKGQDIEYRIRFQNTGNDTAFLVRVLDTLPANLDPASIRPIASSHPYTWDVTGSGLLTFTFDQIMLPDSNTNEAASHGHISFHISQKPHLPDGTMIQNTASIYFDFNDAVWTNTWQHTIGRPTIVGTHSPHTQPKVAVQIAPNPFTSEAVFSIRDYLPDSPMLFSLADPTGKVMRTESFTETDFKFKRKNLPDGVYFWHIDQRGETIARGRVIVK